MSVSEGCMSLSPDIVDVAVLDPTRQEHQLRILARRTACRLAAIHVVARAVPGAHERAVLAFQRPAEMHTDIGGHPNAAAAPVDVNLAPEEGHDDAAALRHFAFRAKPMSHGKISYRCIC